MDEMLNLIYKRCAIKAKIHTYLLNLSKFLSEKSQNKLNHYINIKNYKGIERIIQSNFGVETLNEYLNIQSKLNAIEDKINMSSDEIDKILFMDCMDFYQILKSYFKNNNIQHKLKFYEKHLLVKIGDKKHFIKLIYNEEENSDYIDLYKIIYESEWVKECYGLTELIFDNLEKNVNNSLKN